MCDSRIPYLFWQWLCTFCFHRIPKVRVLEDEEGSKEIELSDDPYDCIRLNVENVPLIVTLSKVSLTNSWPTVSVNFTSCLFFSLEIKLVLQIYSQCPLCMYLFISSFLIKKNWIRFYFSPSLTCSQRFAVFTWCIFLHAEELLIIFHLILAQYPEQQIL